MVRYVHEAVDRHCGLGVEYGDENGLGVHHGANGGHVLAIDHEAEAGHELGVDHGAEGGHGLGVDHGADGIHVLGVDHGAEGGMWREKSSDLG